MGNCCRRESGAVWASPDEWDYGIAPRKQSEEWVAVGVGEGEDRAAPSTSTSTPTPTPLLQETVVKIKISKRELEGLIAAARVHDVPVDRLFSRFIHGPPHPSWAPILLTIPE